MPQDPTKKIPPSRHMVWYREIVPATVPVIILGTGKRLPPSQPTHTVQILTTTFSQACFFTLTLLQTHLSHSRSLSDSSARITRLEEELADLREKHSRQAVNWSEGLGRVVRRVRDLGREVHEFDDLKVLAAAPQAPQTQVGNGGSLPVDSRQQQQQQQQEETRRGSLPARILAAFGGGGGGGGASPSPSQNSTTTASVAEAAHQSAARTASIASSLANTTFQKMDNLRETSTAALSNAEGKLTTLLHTAHSEVAGRVATLPDTPETNLEASIRDAPGGAQFAARLLATFGDPGNDAQETTAEVTRLETLARETSVQDLADKAQGAAHAVSTSMHDKFEVIAERIDPAAQLAAHKLDKLRETSGKVLERVEDKVDALVSDVQREAQERLRTLPATPETDLGQAVKQAPGGESFAARLLATFGNPGVDAEKTRQEVARLETLARETSVQDLTDKAQGAAHVVSESVHDGLERVAHQMDPVARQVGGKMDQLRETSGNLLQRVEGKVDSLVSDVQREAEERLNTLPATPETDLKQAVKQAPVAESFATRLLSTFGNPKNDTRKTTRELSHVGTQLSDLAQEQETRAMHLAQDVVSSVREVEHKVQGGLTELRTEGVKPLVQATSAKLDSLRTTSQHALAHAEQELSSRLPTSLPRPVATADGTYPAETAEQGLLASRLIATFGAPSEDRTQTARDLARLKVQGKEVVERGEEVVRPALERVEGAVQDVKGRVVDEGKKRWWS
ncbi:hypothetical protein QFC22_006127 [Naganishia vaughanmartiniae]|uniref:Uncharacterized protein n=1 Tax=Naganishia vaughanmartiniae TaxID=1424756 RepID=A0ACC2WNJ9_9TREE|nr:hypothetical protein QFC22_006127 [Naganishia vaughanmartiniae]